MKKAQNFTEGQIFKPLIRFALPVLLALFLQSMYGVCDLIIVAQFGGERAVDFMVAVSTGNQVMQMFTIMIAGLAMGLTIFVGRKIGEGNKDEAGRIIGSGIWLFGVIAIALTVVMIVVAPLLTEWLHTPNAVFSETVTYIIICSAGAIFIVAYNLIGSIFRGIGDSKMPLITVCIACGLNIVGDFILVAVFHMGAAGAAIATIFAQAASVLISLVIIKRRELPFTFSLKNVRAKGIYIKEILKLGIPLAFQDLLASISFLKILRIVNEMGEDVFLTGFGVAEKMRGFVMLVASAYMLSMSAFVAQNIGAGKPERARKVLWCGIASSLAVGVVMGLFTFFCGDLLAGIFSPDPEIILAATEYLKAYAIDFVFTSFLFCFIGYFNGCGRTTFVMLQGIICAFYVRIPIARLMSKQISISLFHIGLAIPAATIVQITLCAIYFAVMLRKEKQNSLT